MLLVKLLTPKSHWAIPIEVAAWPISRYLWWSWPTGGHSSLWISCIFNLFGVDNSLSAPETCRTIFFGSIFVHNVLTSSAPETSWALIRVKASLFFLICVPSAPEPGGTATTVKRASSATPESSRTAQTTSAPKSSWTITLRCWCMNHFIRSFTPESYFTHAFIFIVVG